MKIKFKELIKVLILIIAWCILLCIPLTASAQQYNCSQGVHNYEVVTKKATENEDGLTTYTCRICGFSFNRVLPATGHTWGTWVMDKQPTCTSPGHRYRSCTRHANDQHRQQESIPALGHQYKETVTEPTCVEEGYKTYTCERCGDSYTEGYLPASHQYTETAVTEPDCTHAGEKTFTCEVCGDTYTEPYGEALGHQYKEEVVKGPDCENEGKKQFTCEVCGDTYTESIPALGHSFGEWIIDKKATTKEAGYRYKVCDYDENHVVEEVIPKLLETVSTSSSKDSDTFPNHMDIILLSAIAAAAAVFCIVISGDLHVIRWERKKNITYNDWLKMHRS